MDPVRAIDDPRLLKVDFVVEATDCERQYLWTRFAEEGRDFGQADGARVSWSNDRGGGWLPTVGHVGDMPVTVCLTFVWVGGKLVLFHEDYSQVVDYRMIDVWLNTNVPAYANGRRSDAKNFSPGRMG